ncbi:hypothetical protein VTI28DRAFT_8868 [Corynascus sepedonium]
MGAQESIHRQRKTNRPERSSLHSPALRTENIMDETDLRSVRNGKARVVAEFRDSPVVTDLSTSPAVKRL